MSSNPLIEAPHVPKRAPEWGHFIDRAGAAVGQPRQGGRQATQRSVWSQVRSNPLGSTTVPNSHAAGPLKPAWVQQQPDDDAADTDQALQQDASSLQQPAGLGQHNQRQQHTSAAFPQPPAAHQHPSGHPQQATGRTAAHSSAQRGPGSFRAALQGTADTPAHDDSADDLLDMLGNLGDIPNPATQQASSWQPQQGQQHGQQHQQHQHQQRQPTWAPHQQQQQAQQHGGFNPVHQHAPGLARRPWQQQATQGLVCHPQLQNHQQHQYAHHLHQQHPNVNSRRPQAAFKLASDDDVQLPDSWWDNGRQPAAANSNAAAGAGVVSTVGHGGGGFRTAGSRAQTGTGQVLGSKLQQPQQWQHTPHNHKQQHTTLPQGMLDHQQKQQQHQQEELLEELDDQQEDPWLQQQQVPHPHQTHQQHAAPGQQQKGVGWHDSAPKHTVARAQQQQQQQGNHGGRQQQTGQTRTLPWQQQQQQQGVPPPPAPQQHRRTAAASLWSGGTTLASLSRVPAAGASMTAAVGAGTGPAWAAAAPANLETSDTAAAQKSSCLAAAGSTQNQKASKGAGKGSREAKGKAAVKGGSNSSISMEFTPRAPGDAAAQPKLHQTTLKDTLKRAHRNKQRAQQQEGSSEQQGDMQDEEGSVQYQQQDDSVDGIEQGMSTVAAKSAARKRKRSSTAAAAAAAAAAGAAQGSGGSSSGAGSGGGVKAGGSGGGKAKKAPKISKTAAALETAVEALDTWCLSSNAASHQQQQRQQAAVMLDATLPGTAVWQQLQRDVCSSEGMALGVLYSRTVLAPAGGPLAVQYFSSLQPPYKPQQLLLSKAASYAKRLAASSAAGDASAGADAGEAGQDAADTAGVQQVVGIAVMPVARGSTSAAAAAAAAGASGPAGVAAARTSYFVSLQQQQQQQGQQGQLAPHVLQLLQAVLGDPDKRPCVCCSAKAVLCSLAQLGLQLPAASAVNVIDPELLGWLLDPQLIQDTKNEACYTLEQQLSRIGRKVLGVEALGPLQRLHQHLASSLDLATLLYSQLSRRIAGQAIKLEMQVAVLLAKMEVAGVACAPAVLSDHRATLAGRLAAIKARATQLVGHDFNLSSSSQLAKVLYEDLRLTPPTGGGGRGAAKTHLSTNEATLKQLALTHELPGLVLEHRCIVHVMSKWIDAGWVQQAAQQPGGRVHCTWQQTSTATGRLSSCSPNMQAVTKYTITARYGGGAEGTSMLDINVRDAFVAPPGKLLLSADYSQIELRLLAHFSEDQLLRQILSQSSGDVFNMIAAALQQAAGRHDSWLSGAAAGDAGAMQVSPEEREQAKRVVYGIVYGQTAYGLAQQLSDQVVSTAAAQGMIDSFLARFPGVRQFMQRSIAAAQSAGAVSTLMGRSRPIPGLQSGDFQERSAAERKVVNSQIQGSAADLIKLAMCAWDGWAATQQQQPQQQQEAPAPGSSAAVQARLIAQIHDELLFEVDAPDAVLGSAGDLQHPGQHFLQVSAAVKGIMESAARMTVPLRVKLAWGSSWGSITELKQ